ncbi:unnamed protein product, partial [Ixodes persulcatus]
MRARGVGSGVAGQARLQNKHRRRKVRAARTGLPAAWWSPLVLQSRRDAVGGSADGVRGHTHVPAPHAGTGPAPGLAESHALHQRLLGRRRGRHQALRAGRCSV